MTVKKWTRNLALAIILFLPFYYLRFSVAGIPTNVIELLILLLLVLTLWQYRRLRLPNWQPIGLILVGVIISSLVVAADRQAALGIVKGWFVVPLVYYACLATIFEDENPAVIIWPVLLTAVTVAFYAIGQRFGLIPLQSPDALQYISQGRAVGFFESPNFLAMYLVPLTLLAGGYLYLTKNWRPLAWLGLPLVAIFLSLSRAGVLALIAGEIWLVLLKPKSAQTGTRRNFLIVAIGLAVVFLTLSRFSSDQSRLYIWAKAWEMIKQSPLLGIGPGQFQNHFLALDDGNSLFAQAAPYALHPHNVFLNFWLSAGLLGLVGFGWLIVRLAKSVLQDPNRSPIQLAASAGLVAVLTQGLFDSTYFKNDLAIIFWLLVFLASQSKLESSQR